MTALLRQAAWLAAGLLALRAASFRQGLEHFHVEGLGHADRSAFVPGGAAYRPHAQVRPAISVMPAVRSPGLHSRLPALPLRERGRAPAIFGLHAAAGRRQQQAATDFTLVTITVPAIDVLDDWVEYTREASAKARKKKDRETKRVMAGKLAILKRMRDRVAAGTPKHVFALAEGTKPDAIQAVAIVRPQDVWDSWSESHVAVADISDLVTRPASARAGVRSQLIARIIDWGKATGHLITFSAAVEDRDHYRRVGFDVNATVWPDFMVKSAGFQEEPRYAMVALAFEPRRADFGVVQAPLKATVVIDRWAKYAATEEAKALRADDDKTRQSIKDIQSMAFRLRSSIAAGSPDRVFALTTEKGIKDIQAIAMLKTRDMWDGEKRVKVVYLGGLMARPAFAKKGVRVELTHRIINWAAAEGQEVTLTVPKDDILLYKSLGFRSPDADAPNRVYSGHGIEESRLGQQFNMIALEPEERQADSPFVRRPMDRNVRVVGDAWV